jgi:hypothetical protein
MYPSYLLSDPLVDLVRAVVEVLRYGGSAGFGWDYEGGIDRWTLCREGDTLYITIRVGGAFSREDWPDEGSTLKFATTCDLW